MADPKAINYYFLDPPLHDDTLDVYVVRKAILQAVKDSMMQLSGTLLDIGCGQMPYKKMMLHANPEIKNYIGLDLEVSSVHDTSIADIHWNGSVIPLSNDSVDCAMATEVLEHSFQPEETLKEISRVMKSGGRFFFTVPFIWPLHEVPYDAYRYTPFSLKRHLENSGFTGINIKSLGGWHSSFAQMLGLWAKESPLTGFKKKMAIATARKFIPYLLKIDIKDNSFRQHSMISGLCGIAVKE